MSINQKKPTGLPYGSGSLQIRGRVWWMIYKDGEGQTIQESSGTQDRDEAVRLLAGRALPIARARVAALEAACEEAPGKKRIQTVRQYLRGSARTRNPKSGNRVGSVSARSGSQAAKGGRK
jgi:hypothetical protein